MKIAHRLVYVTLFALGQLAIAQDIPALSPTGDLTVPDPGDIPYPSLTTGSSKADNPWLAADLTIKNQTTPDPNSLQSGMNVLTNNATTSWGTMPTTIATNAATIPLACKCCGDTHLHIETVQEMEDLPGQGYYAVALKKVLTACNCPPSYPAQQCCGHDCNNTCTYTNSYFEQVMYQWVGPGYEPPANAVSWATTVGAPYCVVTSRHHGDIESSAIYNSVGVSYPIGSINNGTLAPASEGPPFPQAILDWAATMPASDIIHHYAGHGDSWDEIIYEIIYLVTGKSVNFYKVRVPTRIPTLVSHPETVCANGHWQSKPCPSTNPGGGCTTTIQVFDPTTGQVTTQVVAVPCP